MIPNRQKFQELIKDYVEAINFQIGELAVSFSELVREADRNKKKSTINNEESKRKIE